MRCFIVLLFFFGICSNMFALGLHETVDIEIKVVDSETSEPLSNISIIFLLDKVSGLFIDGDFDIIEYEKYNTDENGIVRIPKKKISSLKFNEMLYAAYIYINIELKKDSDVFYDIEFGLSAHFLFDRFKREYLFSNSEYYSARIAIFFLDGERMIYTQKNDDSDVNKRIQKKSYFSKRKKGQQIVVELVRRIDE